MYMTTAKDAATPSKNPTNKPEKKGLPLLGLLERSGLGL
jgi:hypothetical protein